MALKQTNEIGEVFLQNENLQAEMHIKSPNCIMKTNVSNTSGIKYGLTELSNDKFYLETEMPARKRLKPETELFSATKHLNKICKAVGNDVELANFVNEKKCPGEVLNVLSSAWAVENNPKRAELLKSDLNEDINKLFKPSLLSYGKHNPVFQNILSNEHKVDFSESLKCNFEKKSDIDNFERNSKSDLCKNVDNRISYPSEIEFEDEINKCCELLNLDVPRMEVVETTATKSTNSQIQKCEIGHLNDKKQSFDTLNHKNLKIQDKLLNKRESSCGDNIYLKDEYNSVLSTKVNSYSFSTVCGENCIDNEDKIFQNEINKSVEKHSLESELKPNDENNSTLKINKISNLNNISNKSNTFIPPMIQNQGNQRINEHLDLTTENTLRSDNENFQDRNQENICQDNLNDEISSTVSDSGDTLILYDGSDIDFDETKEICQTNASESAQASNNNETALHASLDDTIRSNTINKLETKSDLVSSKNIISLDQNLPLDNMSGELKVLDDLSNNDHNSDINDFNAKADEPFVSEYEISLLVDDTDSIVSDESLDSEYEISLLEDDINDKQNQDESLVSEYEVSLLEGDINEENLDESFDSEYEVSLLEDDISDNLNQNDMDENKNDSNISAKYLNNNDENDKTVASPLRQAKLESNQTNIDNLCEKEIGVFENSKLDVNTNAKTEEHFTTITDDKMVLKLSRITTLVSEEKNVVDDILIKKELPENKGSPFLLKLEMNNESETQNKLIGSQVSNPEETINITTKIQHAGSFITNSSIIERSVKAEVDIFDAGKSKYVNDKLKVSNEVELMNKTKISEENALIICKKKQLTENSSTDKAVGENAMKTDLSVTENSELHELNNKFQPSNKGAPMKETKISEVEETIADRNKQLAEIVFPINNTIDEKTMKTDLSLSTSSELKDVNKKFQPSIKVELISKTKRSEEKTSIVYNEKLPESTSTDITNNGMIVKTDLGVSASSELKRETENIIPDYYEEEKEDLINPGWNKIKCLSTDEQRYRQVRDCWKSKIIPNPFKNLTYYSYRKRKINLGENNTQQKAQTRQHKRHASNNLNDKTAKRSRTCTFIFDDRIESIQKEKEKKAQLIQNKMYNEVNWLNEQCLQEEQRLQNFYDYNDPLRQQYELHGLRREFQQRISSVTAEYEQKVYNCCDQYTSEINSLKKNRNEVFQFYNFYKGLNPNEYKDPTVLSNEQLQELEEIENIYIQMDRHYN